MDKGDKSLTPLSSPSPFHPPITSEEEDKEDPNPIVGEHPTHREEGLNILQEVLVVHLLLKS